MTSPYNVLHTVRSLRLDGVTKVVIRSIAHRQSAEFRDHVCSMMSNGALADECRAAGVEPVFLNYSGAASARATVAKLVRFIRERRIDVVHANRTLDLALAGTAARLCGVPVVSTLHWLGRIEDHPEDGDATLLRKAEMMAPVMLNRLLADRVIAVSRAVRDSFAALPGFPADRVVVVYPGQETALSPTNSLARNRLRLELGLEGAQPVLLNVGRLQPVKGQLNLIPMMRQVRVRFPHAVLLVAGEGEMREALTHATEVAGLQGAIRLLGARADVDALLSVSDVLILASESEAAPLPVFEAMRAGKPVVATRVGGVPEIVQSGTTGLIVPRGDPAAMAAAVEQLAASPEYAVRMGDAGRRLLIDSFDITRALQQTEDVYRALIPATPASADRMPNASRRTDTPDGVRPPSR